MKITTRIISGYGLLIAVLAGLAVYQYLTIAGMVEINETLKNINLESALASATAWNALSQVGDYAKRSFVDRDFYEASLRESREDFIKNLEALKNYANSAKEQAEVKRLSEQWIAFDRKLHALLQEQSRGGTDFPDVLQIDLKQMSAQIDTLFKISKESIASKVQESSDTAKTAMYVLWSTTILALAISILVSCLIFRSISKPLAGLTEGTRSITRGKFHYRLDTSRDDEFAQLAKDFNAMTRRLNELDELKKGFVSHVSHELKVPMASMQEIIQLLLDEIPGPLTEKQKGLLELNLRSGLRLTSMINNLLDLSKMEAGMMEYEFRSQDLIPLVRNAVAELEVQALERKMQIKANLPEEPLEVECDSDRIIQVIVNLVGNAVKFSAKSRIVEVKAEAIPEIPSSMPKSWRSRLGGLNHGRYFGLVTISDSGPGIPDSDKEMIFERFHQIKQSKRTAGQGVGLGLAICRAIVVAHHGAIWVEDNPGGGSRFQLLLRPGKKN